MQASGAPLPWAQGIPFPGQSLGLRRTVWLVLTWQGIADELQILVDRGENFVARAVDDGTGWDLPLIGLKRARRWGLKVQNVAKRKPRFPLAPRVIE